MKTLVLFVVSGLSILTFYPPSAPYEDADLHRFAITIKGKAGFINTAGEVVIKPQYASVEDFSEGLCAVRMGGTYGFIDTQGNIRISPQYDYATEFREDMALVFLEGKPLFIDKAGRRAFESGYKIMTHFVNGKSHVVTKSGKAGVIAKTGELLIDTVYKFIGPFEDGLAIVHGLEHRTSDSEDQKKNLQISVINEQGKLLVPYGKFEGISNYSEGFFEVNWPTRKGGNVTDNGIMNKNGEIVYTLPSNEISWIDGAVNNGILRVTFPFAKGRNKSGKYYEGYITPYGKPVHLNRDARYGNDFSEGFAFYRNDDDRYSLINTKGEVVVRNKFIGVAGTGFKNGTAIVRTNDGWGVIDTTGSFILQPRFENIIENDIIDDLIFFEDTISGESRNYPKYGISDLTGNVVVPPSFEFFDTRGFVNGLLKTSIDGRLAYYNRSWKIVWQEEEWIPEDLQTMNIDYMNRGYFYANYNYTGHGNSPSRSQPEKITVRNNFSDGVLSLIANPFPEIEFGKSLKGMIVYVVNATSDTIHFNAQDSRLYMKMQASDRKGAWRDIEYLPSSWCGNSYHSVDLPVNHYWTFVAPIYEGSFSTKLRIELTYVDPSDKLDVNERGRFLDHAYRDKRELKVYSNEFEGTINPAQFWRWPGYHATGIMDPYNE